MIKVVGKGQKERIIPIGSKALDSIKKDISMLSLEIVIIVTSSS